MSQKKKTTSSNPYADQARLATIQEMLCVRIDELFNELEVDLSRSNKMYFGCCPIHGGDNKNALNLYHSGDTVPGFWRCYTKGCEKTFMKTIIGFVRGVLSHRHYGWSSTEDTKTVSFKDTVDWCCNFLGQKIQTIEVDDAHIEKKNFISRMQQLMKKPKSAGEGLSRDKVRSLLDIPATYFVNRGWSKDILDLYDVGLCNNPAKPMYNRVVVPVYNEKHLAVGYTGRSIFDRCDKCKMYHNPKNDCPKKEDSLKYSKWRNSKGFNRESHFYNLHRSGQKIRNTGVVALCEGPGDIWRLEEAKIPVGVGMFGIDLTDQQQVLLEMSGAMNVIVLTNMDEAGKKARTEIPKQLERCFNVFVPELPKNDLGSMLAEEVYDVVGPIYEKCRRK